MLHCLLYLIIFTYAFVACKYPCILKNICFSMIFLQINKCGCVHLYDCTCARVGYTEVCITTIILLNLCLVNNYIQKHT